LLCVGLPCFVMSRHSARETELPGKYTAKNQLGRDAHKKWRVEED
jgi:hypothetical protein